MITIFIASMEKSMNLVMKKVLGLKYWINWTLYLNYFNLWLILLCIALILYIGYLDRYTEMCVYVYKM